GVADIGLLTVVKSHLRALVTSTHHSVRQVSALCVVEISATADDLRAHKARHPADRGVCRAGYCARYPPSITSSAPVMKLDSSQARKRQPLAISSGVPARFIGVMPMMLALMAGS